MSLHAIARLANPARLLQPCCSLCQRPGSDVPRVTTQRVSHSNSRRRIGIGDCRFELFDEVLLGFMECAQQSQVKGSLARTGSQTGDLIDTCKLGGQLSGCLGNGHLPRPAPAPGPWLDPPGQRGEHAVYVQWLGQVVIHAAGQGAFAVPGHGVGGHGDDRQRREVRLLANPAGRGIAVHHRHLAVHQHTVEIAVPGQPVECLLAIICQLELDACLLQQVARQLPVQFVVLHQQQARPLQACHVVSALLVALMGAGTGLRHFAEHCAYGFQQGGRSDRLGQHHRQMDVLVPGLFK
ncbi:hypothetical protein D3C73_506390 [compost metagenome]